MRKIFVVTVVWALMLLCVRCASAQLVPGDDYDPLFPVGCGSNSNPNASGCSSYGTALYTFLAGESPAEKSEYGWANFVVAPGTYGSPSFTYTVPANDCLGVPVAGLTHTPQPCYAYNANVRATETGAITYPDNDLCWVGIDQNRSGVVGDPPNFSRVAGEHYILDCFDIAQPNMTPSSQLLMQVTTSGGAITQVIDLRRVGPIPSYLNPPQGIFNVAAFSGWSSSTTSTTVTITAGSSSGTLTSASGFNPGDQVLIRHAGANSVIAAPIITSISPLTDGLAIVGEHPATSFTGDGATKCFLAALAHGHIKIGSVLVTDPSNSVTSLYDKTFGVGNTFNPTGHGIIPASTGVLSGDVDYVNGRVGICFSVAPAAAASLTVNYSYVANNLVPAPTHTGCTKDITTDNGTESGSNCLTAWGFQVVAVGANGSSSPPSSLFTVQNVAKYPSWANRLRMAVAGDPNAVGYRIYAVQDPSNSNPALGTPTLIATNDNIWYKTATFTACAGCTTPTNYDYDYIGTSLPGNPNAPADMVDGQALPTGAEAADCSLSIATINGTAVTFAGTPSCSSPQQSGTLTIVHDNTPPIIAAIAAATTASSVAQEIWIPCGTYSIASTLNITNQIALTIHGCSTGSSVGHGTKIYWYGGAAMTAFNMLNDMSTTIENLSFGGTQNLGSDLGAWISHDRFAPVLVSPTHLRLLHDSFRNAGDPVVIANRGNANTENAYIEDTWMQGLHWHQYSYYIAGAGQTNANIFQGGGVNRSDVGWMLNGAGEAWIDNSQGNLEMVEFADGEPLGTSNITKNISVNHFYTEQLRMMFELTVGNETQPAEFTDGWYQPAVGSSLSIPSTTQPSIPASGVIGLANTQAIKLSGNYIGNDAVPVPQQLWVSHSVLSNNNLFSQTVPPYVVFSTVAVVASNADRIAAQGNNWASYGILRGIGSLPSPVGPGISSGNVLTAPKISGFTTVAMPTPTTTLAGSGAGTCTYQIVIVDSNGNAVGPSVAASTACPGVGSFCVDPTNAACWVKISTSTTGLAADHFDVLTSATRTADTAHTIGSFPCSGGGVCYGFDLGQGVMPYTPPVRPNSADITMAAGGQYHNTPVLISTLPTTCKDGDEQMVSDWNATIGTCTGGGTTRVRATCNNANVWQCP